MSVSAIRANRKREHFFDHPPGKKNGLSCPAQPFRCRQQEDWI
jgi:hypothetical protein